MHADEELGFLGACFGSCVGIVITIVLCILMLAATWVIYTKAGKPGWTSLIPFYNTYVLFQIAMGEDKGIYMLTMFIPFVNIVMAFKVYIDLAKSFGKTGLYGVLMLFFPFILLPILAFGSARYCRY